MPCLLEAHLFISRRMTRHDDEGMLKGENSGDALNRKTLIGGPVLNVARQLSRPPNLIDI